MARSRATTHPSGEPEQLNETGPGPEPGGDEPLEHEAVHDSPPPVTRGGTIVRGRALGVSVPGAIAGVLLVTALAFGVGGFNPIGSDGPGDGSTGRDGAGASQPVASENDGGAGAGADGADDGESGADASTGPGGSAGPDGDGSPDGSEAPDGCEAPNGCEAPDATPVAPERLVLEARVTDGNVRLDWSACDPAGFAFYKVVRSTDATVTWPKGGNDTLIAALEDPARSAWTDAKAPQGRKLWYRVFGLVERDSELVVGCVSNVDGIATPEPPEPSVKPTPAPAALGLTVAIKEGHPWLDWSACSSDAFDVYKVVRSMDATVTWPTGDNDVLVAAIGNRSESAFWDKGAPGGRTLYYRVFCLDKTETGYRVLASSGVKPITTPAPTPPPDPVVLGFEVTVGVDGGVVLDWTACGSDAFVYYKVVRSASPNPSYLPWTDGTQLRAVIESQATSAWTDAGVEPGQTWYYRVQAIGLWNGEKVVLGQTAAIEVTVP